MALLNLRPYQKPVVNPVKTEPKSAFGKLFLGGGLFGSTEKKVAPSVQNYTRAIPTFSGPMSKDIQSTPFEPPKMDSSKPKIVPVVPKAPTVTAPLTAQPENQNINILGQDITPKPEKQPTLREKIAGAGLALQKGSSVYDSLLQQSRSLREQAAARQKALEAAYQPSSQEQALQRQIADLTTSAEQGVAGLEGQGRGIPLGLVRGQQAKLEEQANIRLGGLGRALTAEQAIRQGAIDQAKAGLEALNAEQEAAVQQAQIEQMAKTDARSQQINQAIALAPGANIIDKYNALLDEGIIDATDVPEAIHKVIFSGPEAYKPITLGYGETLVDPYTGQPIAMGQQKPVEAITPYQQAQLDIQRQQLAQGKAPTEAQSKAALFGARAQQAEDTINTLGSKFTGQLSRLPTFDRWKSQDRLLFEQAERNFINAVLRRESGAVISPEEFSNARNQYIPQPGDTDAVLAAKKQNRDLVTKGLVLEGGKATTNLSGNGDFSW